MLGPGPGLDGSCGLHHPSSYDMKLLILVCQTPETERIQLRL